MQEIISINDVVKILLKKIKIIICIALIVTLSASCLAITKNKKPLYEVKIYGIINGSYDRSLTQIVNTVSDIYSSDLIAYSLNDMDVSNLSDAYLQKYDKLSPYVMKNFKTDFNESSRMFNISYSGEDEGSVDYIAEYIFSKGVELANLYIENINIEQMDKITDEITYDDEFEMNNDIVFGALSYFIASVLLISLFYVFKVIVSGRIYCSNQFETNYNLKILSVIKNKKFNTEEIKTLLLLLKKDKKKEIIFFSSNNYDNYSFLHYLKSICEKNGQSAAIVDAASDSVKQKYMLKYDNDASKEEKKRFFEQLSGFDYIFIKADSILISAATAELAMSYKHIILIEKCGQTKYEDINKTLEKIKQFNAEVQGIIVAE